MSRGSVGYDILGKRFGKLLVLSRASEKTPSGHVLWECQCDCGNGTKALSSNLVSGNTTSCGCLKVERNTTHGMSSSPEYMVWEGMIRRCENKNFKQFEDYGGRGIKICKRWRESFKNFYEDMGPRPSAFHTIDREDNDGDYEPNNCRWATRAEQVRNRRNNVYYQYKGEWYSIHQLAELPEVKAKGVNFNTLKSRIRFSKWSVEDAINTPIKPRAFYTHNGVTKTISEWAREYNFNYDCLYSRIVDHGWDLEKAISTPRVTTT